MYFNIFIDVYIICVIYEKCVIFIFKGCMRGKSFCGSF